MPSHKTFTIKPFKELIEKELGSEYVDPFPYPFTQDAIEYLKTIPTGSVKYCVFDPPYSQRQLKEMYHSNGLSFTYPMNSSYWAECKKEISNNVLPLIAIPTTAGTGSELSKGSIISWPEKAIKSGIRGDAVFPTVALVDPSLTLTLPIEQVKITGFDCLAHAIETYISKIANPCKYLILLVAGEGFEPSTFGL